MNYLFCQPKTKISIICYKTFDVTQNFKIKYKIQFSEKHVNLI